MHMIKQDQSKVRNMDLLWRYYEKNRSFGKAAHVLARLADMHRCVMTYSFTQCPMIECGLSLIRCKLLCLGSLSCLQHRDLSTAEAGVHLPGHSFSQKFVLHLLDGSRRRIPA